MFLFWIIFHAGPSEIRMAKKQMMIYLNVTSYMVICHEGLPHELHSFRQLQNYIIKFHLSSYNNGS